MQSTRRKSVFVLASAALLLVLLAQPAPAAGQVLGRTQSQYSVDQPQQLEHHCRGPPGAGQPVAGDDVNLTSTTNKTAFYDTTLNPTLSDVYRRCHRRRHLHPLAVR